MMPPSWSLLLINAPRLCGGESHGPIYSSKGGGGTGKEKAPFALRAPCAKRKRRRVGVVESWRSGCGGKFPNLPMPHRQVGKLAATSYACFWSGIRSDRGKCGAGKLAAPSSRKVWPAAG